MRMKRRLALSLAVLMLMVFGAAALAESAQQQEGGTFGQVTQIDGNTVTIALVSMGGPGGQNPGNAPSGASGQNPGNPPSDASRPNPRKPPAGHGGPNPRTPPTGHAGPRRGGNGQSFGTTLTGETLTFTMNDATAVILRGGRDAQDATGSLLDVQVGSLISVTLADSLATQIVVRQMPTTPEAAEIPAAN